MGPKTIKQEKCLTYTYAGNIYMKGKEEIKEPISTSRKYMKRAMNSSKKPHDWAGSSSHHCWPPLLLTRAWGCHLPWPWEPQSSAPMLWLWQGTQHSQRATPHGPFSVPSDADCEQRRCHIPGKLFLHQQRMRTVECGSLIWLVVSLLHLGLRERDPWATLGIAGPGKRLLSF